MAGAHLEPTPTVVAAAPELLRKNRKDWLDLLEQDHDNINLTWRPSPMRPTWRCSPPVRGGSGRREAISTRPVGGSRRFWHSKVASRLAGPRPSKLWAESCGGNPISRRARSRETVRMHRDLGDPREL